MTEPDEPGSVGGSSYHPAEPAWPLPVVERPEPIRARKLARISLAEGRLVFRGWSLGGCYGADAVAAHRGVGRPAHPAPDPTGQCRDCGFHALRHLDATWSVVLDVELFGTVVAHSRGWRASRQRVLTCWLDPSCRLCGARPTGLGYAARLGEPQGVFAVCSACRVQTIALADAAGHLGCEVRWRPLDRLPPMSAWRCVSKGVVEP